MNKQKIDRAILALYEKDETIVNNDARLIAAIYYEFGWDDQGSLYENLKRMPHPESITRRRRTLHVDGKIKYSPEVDRRRFRRFKETRDEYAMRSAGVAFIPTDTTEKH